MVGRVRHSFFLGGRGGGVRTSARPDFFLNYVFDTGRQVKRLLSRKGKVSYGKMTAKGKKLFENWGDHLETLEAVTSLCYLTQPD